jgi:hypothetical protein
VSVVYSPTDSCAGVDAQPAVTASTGNASATAITRRVKEVFDVFFFCMVCVSGWTFAALNAQTHGLQQVSCQRGADVQLPSHSAIYLSKRLVLESGGCMAFLSCGKVCLK